MSDNHQQGQSELDADVDKKTAADAQNAKQSRRKILKAAIAAPPVLMTLTSRPVHAVQGLSNMLSGDSSQCRGDTKYGGMSPGFWKLYDEQGGTDVYGDRHNAAWDATPYDYGTFDPAGTENQEYKNFIGGTLYDDVFGSGYSGMTLREVLNEENGSNAFHWVAGLLNAHYFEAKAIGGESLYFMTVDQFWRMHDDSTKVPSGYDSLKDLIESSYHLNPGSDCEEII